MKLLSDVGNRIVRRDILALPVRLTVLPEQDAMGAPRRAMAIEFHNTGLYNLRGPLSYPTENTGVFEITRLRRRSSHATDRQYFARELARLKGGGYS